jgi:hypothetical protein
MVGASRLRLIAERSAPNPPKRGEPVSCLGLIPVRRCREEFKFISAIARYFRLHQPELTLFVFGDTVDDLGIMQIGNSYVTGAVPPEELPHVSQTYGVQALLLSATSPLFGHPATEFAHSASIPVAYFDWSECGAEADTSDLALNPEISRDEHFSQLSDWLHLS